MDAAHQDLILDQFTRQASPFSAAPMITDEIPLRMIVEAAQATSDDIILDVACGPGLVVCPFAPHVREATGIDLTLAMFERARQLAPERGVRNVARDRGDACSLPYADGTRVREGAEQWREAGIITPVLVALSPDGNQMNALKAVFAAFER
jgi:SAM-dependent methyltransferase